jgi:predicted enzyme related to lactoylglutathione lyase
VTRAAPPPHPDERHAPARAAAPGRARPPRRLPRVRRPRRRGRRRARRFYERAFGWLFTDYGPDYASFVDGRLAGGFTTGRAPTRGGALVVLFALDLADAERRVLDAGGAVVTPAYDFPGGRRFHFADPAGNELAVWSDR